MPNSSSKRKASEIAQCDSPEPTRELTKREKLLLAKGRAQEFARRDKARIDDHAAKKQDHTVRQLDDDNSNNFAEPKRKKKKIESNEPIKTNRKLLQKQRKKKASENAQIFAARDKARLEQAKSANTSKTTPAQSIAAATAFHAKQVLPPPPPVATYSTTSVSIQNTANQILGAADPFLLVQHEEEQKQKQKIPMEHLRLQQQSRLKEKYEQHQEQQKVIRLSDLLSPATSTPLTTTMPVMKIVPAASNNNEDDDDDDDDDYMSPPTELQEQISQLVLVNARDFDDDDKSDEDVLLDDDDQEGPSAVDINAELTNSPIHDNDNNLELQKKKPNRFLHMTTITLLITIIFIVLMVPAPSFDEAEKTSSSVVNEPQCFFDSESGDEGICSENSDDGIPCPVGGLCEGGKLTDCPNKFQDLSDKGDQCILSEKYLSMVVTITNDLVNHASKSCNKFAEPTEYALLKREHPEILVEESRELIDVLKCEGYRIYEEDDSLYLGLPENFNLNLPSYCKLGDAVHSILETIGSLLWNIISIIVINFWGLLTNYPKLSGSGLFVFGSFLVYRKRRARREQRERKIDQLRGKTYSLLKGSPNPTPHIVLHIRDEFAMQLYPHSRKKRQVLITEIWPRIVNSVKYDTRVRKTKRMVDGNTRDVWQWVAVETPIQG